MSLALLWDYAALTAFDEVPWPVSAEVDAAILRFAAGRAAQLDTGRYRLRVAGFDVALRVDRRLGTVLVLHVYRTP
jgi:hypothetical protein